MSVRFTCTVESARVSAISVWEDAQIAQIAGHAVRHDLAATVRQQFVAACKPLEHEVHAVDRIAFLQ
jgi:hypothetical protein